MIVGRCLARQAWRAHGLKQNVMAPMFETLPRVANSLPAFAMCAATQCTLQWRKFGLQRSQSEPRINSVQAKSLKTKNGCPDPALPRHSFKLLNQTVWPSEELVHLQALDQG